MNIVAKYTGPTDEEWGADVKHAARRAAEVLIENQSDIDPRLAVTLRAFACEMRLLASLFDVGAQAVIDNTSPISQAANDV